MKIQGSQVVFLNQGDGVITLPKKGLTVVGITVFQNYITIPTSVGKEAVFVGPGTGTYLFVPVKHLSESGQINVSAGGSTCVIVYYGVPDASTPPLSAYEGVAVSASITVGASLSAYTLQTTNVSVTLPASAVQIVGYEYSTGQNLPSGVDSNGIFFQFPTGTGESISLGVTVAPGFVPDFPTSSGVMPIDVPASSSFEVTVGGYFTNSGTSTASVGLVMVLYYR